MSVVVSLGVIGLWAAPASAAVNCEFNGGEMRITMTSDGSSARLSLVGPTILVNESTCGSVPFATTLNTDRINVKDTTARGDTGFVIDLSGGDFEDSGGDEIPMKVNLGAGNLDTFAVGGGSGDDFWTFGNTGANLQRDAEAEIAFVRPPDVGLAVPGDGADRACAGGGRGTGNGSFFSWIMSGGSDGDALCGGSNVDRISGGAGPDRLRGSRSGDRLNGDAGNDRLFGSSGIDELRGHAGKDLLDGGANPDTCRGGKGRDTLRRCEGR